MAIKTDKTGLREAMRNQHIRQLDLKKEFGVSRQLIGRQIREYEEGTMDKYPELKARFDSIIAQESINRRKDGRMTVFEKNEENLRKARYAFDDTISKIQKILEDRCPPEMKRFIADRIDWYNAVKEDFEPVESWKNELLNLAKEQDKEVLENLLSDVEKNLMALRQFNINADDIDEVEEYITLWDTEHVSEGRPNMHIDGFIESFGMISGSSSQVCAYVRDSHIITNGRLKVEAYIYVATDQSLWAVDHKVCEKINTTDNYTAKFEGLIPGYKYFYQVTCQNVLGYDDLPGEAKKNLPETFRDVEFFNEYYAANGERETDYHPLK